MIDNERRGITETDEILDPVAGRDKGRRERLRRVREAREQRIREFMELQRSRREWINFVEIAKWYCNATRRTDKEAQTALRAAIEFGDFETAGQSRIVFLHPWQRLLRMRRSMTREILQDTVILERDDARVWSNCLAYCWVSNFDTLKWFAAQNLPPPAALCTVPAKETGVDDPSYYPIPTQAPRGRQTARAWQALKRCYLDGRVPRISRRQLTDTVNKRLKLLPPEQFSQDTIERALGIRK
jgi:hypothetical protein